MRITDHRLDTAEWVPAEDMRGVIRPEAIVIHYTAGGSAPGSVSWLSQKDSTYVSAHLVIDRTGYVFQLIPFNRKALHAGVSEWKGRENLNNWSIGIELANWGIVTKKKDGGFISWAGSPVASSLVRRATHKNGLDAYWEVYSGAQTYSLVEVCQALVEQYGISILVGHDDVAPTRKTDPGPLLDMDELRTSVLPPKTEVAGVSMTPEDKPGCNIVSVCSSILSSDRVRAAVVQEAALLLNKERKNDG